jgi:hypothetical protein
MATAETASLRVSDGHIGLASSHVNAAGHEALRRAACRVVSPSARQFAPHW